MELKERIWELVLEVLREDMHEVAEAWRGEAFCVKEIEGIEDDITYLADRLEYEIIEYDNYVASGDAKEDEVCRDL